MKIHDLRLTPGVRNALIETGIKTVDDLKSLSEQELMSIKGIGVRKAVEIQRRMSAVGLRLRGMVDPVATWQEFPLHQPDPGLYIVAIQFHFSIIYDVGEWKDGEWIRLFEDDRVIAFMPFPKYEGTKKGTTETETDETPHHS